MPRFPQAIAQRGSQKWLQILVNRRPELLERLIHERLGSQHDRIQWVSPVEKDDYAEYRDRSFIERLDVKLEKVSLESYWPLGGPRWDALGRTEDSEVFLVEAKSHIEELISTLRARDDSSKNKIRGSLDKIRGFMNGRNDVDWASGFYQYANRLAHLYLLRELNGLRAYLVFIYFTNDPDMGRHSEAEWKGAIRLVKSYLGIDRHRLERYVADIFVDTSILA